MDLGGFEDPTPLNNQFGQPFASYSLSIKQPVEQDRTILGKLINRTKAYSTWQISLKYNPMTKAEFDPVYRFLMHRRGSLKPFFVELPNYQGPKDLGFNNIVSTLASPAVAGYPYSAGVTSIQLALEGYWPADDYSAGVPSPGDLFTLRDEYDSLHTKAYMVTRVETTIDYQTGNAPDSQQVRIHFTPGLQRGIQGTMLVNFVSPRFRVVQTKDITEYALNTEDLYSFSVGLEEALY